MHAHQKELAKIINSFATGDGKFPSPIPGVHCIKISHPTRRNKGHWHACFGVIAQGSKEIVVGEDVYKIDHHDYVATPVDLPVISRIETASPEKPFLSLLIEIDHLMLSEVAAQLEQDFSVAEKNDLRSVFVGKTNEKMMEASLRLARLFHTPEDAPVLARLLIKEILYYLLKSSDGPGIQQFVRSGSKMHKVSKAIHSMNAGLAEEVDVVKLAKNANMSRSAFFKHFKDVTAVSPIQYQKRLRLIEARRLLMEQDVTAEGVAFQVGYKSPSQFSREYTRMFGSSPVKHALRLKKG